MKDYTFKYNIGAGLVACSPEFSNLSLRKSREYPAAYARVTVDGVVTFKGAEFDSLHTLLAAGSFVIPFQILYNATSFFDGFLDLYGEYHEDQKLCNLKVVADDYYQKILKGLTQDIDIINSSSIKYRVHLNTGGDNFYYTRNQKLFNVIEYMVQTLDSRIMFDSDSFKSIYDLSIIASGVYDNLMIAGMSDFILSGGVEKSNAQTLGLLSLEEVLIMLWELMKIQWRIDIISGTPYFRLFHKSQVSYGAGASQDFTNFKGKDWSSQNGLFSITNENVFRKIQRKILAGNTDFIGFDINITKYDDNAPVKNIDVSTFSFDVEDMRSVPERYSGNSTDQFVITCPEKSVTALTHTMELIANDIAVYAISATPPPIDEYTIVVITVPAGPPIATTGSYRMKFLNGISDVPFYTGQAFNLGINIFAIAGFYVYVRPAPALLSKLKINADNMVQFDAGDGYGVTDWVPLFPDGFAPLDLIDQDTFFQITCLANSGIAETIELQLFCDARGFSHPGPDMSVQPATGNTYILIEEEKYTLNKHAVKDTTPRYNGHLSLAYIDSTTGLYELPDTSVLINGETSPTVATSRKIRQQKINVPVKLPDEVDFDYICKTGLGDTEPEVIDIKLNNGFATYTGLL